MGTNVRERRPRALQQVSTIHTRKTVVAWMVDDQELRGSRGLYSRTVQAFPEHFRAQHSTNLVRATRWWALRDTLLPTAKATEHIALSCGRSNLG